MTAAHHLVGGRLVHAALDVGARVDAEHVTGRRDRIVGRRRRVGRIRVGDDQPRVVERGVLRVELLPLLLHVGIVSSGGGGAVEDGEAVAHQLAVVDQRRSAWSALVRPGAATMLISSMLRREKRPVRSRARPRRCRCT